MESISLKANAKINLALDVIRRRDDGYHEVKMIMQSVDIFDEITIRKDDQSGIKIHVDTQDIPNDENNLIYKAAKLLRESEHISQGISIRLKKVIPIAAGMAGGSTDAAATLLGINELFELGKTKEELMKFGVQIGADVPYCIMGGTALSEGIGEVLTKLASPPQCVLLIAKPDIAVSTKYVYENLDANELKYHPNIDAMIDRINEKDLHGVCRYMENVLETVTVKEYPLIEQIKDKMKQGGAINAIMSGSGPTVFGVFETYEEAESAYHKLKEAKLAKQLFITRFAKA